MNALFAQKTGEIPKLFAELASAEPFLEKGVSWQASKSGVYAFFEEGKPLHVGRTRHLQRRLRGHITSSRFSASFAFKCVRRKLKLPTAYRTKGSRADLMNDASFLAEFANQLLRTKAMAVRFVEVDDPVLQYLLELYACLEWGLSLDEFDTH